MDSPKAKVLDSQRPMKRKFLCVFSVTLLTAATTALAQLERCLEAHGGLSRWRSFGGVEYDLTSTRENRKDHQLFDLQRRAGLITGEHYSIGTNGKEVWAKADLKALGELPPRFYMWTPFYFFGMPFVFADSGARQVSLGKRNFQGKEYDAVKITFVKGTGDAPDDYYVAYLDPDSGQLKLASYIVTYPAMRNNRPISELQPHAVVFDDWQRADGLLVPKTAVFYKWDGEKLVGEPLGRLLYTNVRFSEAAPEEYRFRKPPDAIIAPL